MTGSTAAARDDGGPTEGPPESQSAAGTPEPPDRWTILGMIRWSTDYLEQKGVENARLDAEHLLAASLGVERLQLYLQFERPLTPDELADFKPLLLRRAAREPLQYILGHTPFREIDLRTDGRALIPRPETEMLVQEVLDRCTGRSALSALDLGTGTGAIALSLVVEGDFARVVATDASAAALELARENAEALGIEIDFREGDLFGPLAAGERFDVIVSNPPYVEETQRGALQPELVEWEPAAALFAGPDGMEVVNRIVDGAPEFLAPAGLLALEVGEGQAEGVRDRIASKGEYTESNIRRDLAGRVRFVIAERA